MKTDKRSEYLTRESIMELLSDDEIAKVALTKRGPTWPKARNTSTWNNWTKECSPQHERPLPTQGVAWFLGRRSKNKPGPKYKNT
jgi:hypothetical protein